MDIPVYPDTRGWGIPVRAGKIGVSHIGGIPVRARGEGEVEGREEEGGEREEGKRGRDGEEREGGGGREGEGDRGYTPQVMWDTPHIRGIVKLSI